MRKRWLKSSIQQLSDKLEQTLIEIDEKFEEVTTILQTKANASDMELFITLALDKCNENTDRKFGRYLGVNINNTEYDENNNMIIKMEDHKWKILEVSSVDEVNKNKGGNQNKCLNTIGRRSICCNSTTSK
jgi:hypothetical protein